MNLEIHCYFSQGQVIGTYREYNKDGILITTRELSEPTKPWDN